MCSNCTVCLEYRKSNTKEPLINHEVPQRAWSKVGTDLFCLNSENYIIIVDYYSKFPEIQKLEETTSSSVITALKSVFARYGIPDIVVSDNGPQYSSHEFKQFAQTWQFQHVTSSPGYAQSNGMTERSVQTIKHILKKSIKNGDDPYLTLLEYRNTPVDESLGSPSQLLMNRRTKTLIPISTELLKPEVKSEMKVQVHLENKQKQQKVYYDKRTSNLSKLEVGDSVRVQNRDKTWEPAKFVAKTKFPRSFIVQTKGGEYRRNRRHLIKTNENPPNYETSEMNITGDNDQPQVQVHVPK